jgi:hypothetical protein
MLLGDNIEYTARYPPGGFFPPAFSAGEKSGQQRNMRPQKTLALGSAKISRRR